jgi:hypothetical protein
MAMTREQVLAEMEADFELMTSEDRNSFLFTHEGKDWTPALLIQEVRDNTAYGQSYVQSWSANRDQQGQLEQLLAALLGGGPGALSGAGLMTCGDPDCPNCKGEVRPFDQLDAAPDSGHTIH